MCLFCPFRTALITVHGYFLFFLFPSISSAVPVYHFCFVALVFFIHSHNTGINKYQISAELDWLVFLKSEKAEIVQIW